MPAEEQLAALLEEGKGLLRQGRELSRSGYAYGEADALLQDAMTCFEEAAAIAPTSTKVLVCVACSPWSTPTSCLVKCGECRSSERVQEGPSLTS